jgi:hypothetical protein
VESPSIVADEAAVRFFQCPANRLVTDRINHFQANQGIGQQLQCPPVTPFGRLTASQRDQSGLSITVKLTFT